MNIAGLNTLSGILIVASLFLLAFLLITNPRKVNNKANITFGLFMLVWASFWTEEVVALTGGEMPGGMLLVMLRSIQFLAPVLFYYAVIFFTRPYHQFTSVDLKYFILPVLYLLGLTTSELSPGFFLPPYVFTILILGQSFYFTIASYLMLKKHEKRIELFSSATEDIDLRWIKEIIITLILISIFMGVYNAIFQGQNLNIFANLTMLGVVYFISYNAIRQERIFLVSTSEVQKISEEEELPVLKKPALIPEEEISVLKIKLRQLMETQRPYLEQTLNLKQLSSMMELTPHQLSYLINEGFDENFFQFVNAYRVELAKTLLLDKKHNHLSIVGIGFEAGFNSKTAFNTVFKKFTGLTPSAFKRAQGIQ